MSSVEKGQAVLSPPIRDGRRLVDVAIGGLLLFSLLTLVIIGAGPYYRSEHGKNGPSSADSVIAGCGYGLGVVLPIIVVTVAYFVRRKAHTGDRPSILSGLICLLLAAVWSLGSTIWIGYAVGWSEYPSVQEAKATENQDESEQARIARAEKAAHMNPRDERQPETKPLPPKTLAETVNNCCMFLNALLVVALCLDLYNVPASRFQKKKQQEGLVIGREARCGRPVVRCAQRFLAATAVGRCDSQRAAIRSFPAVFAGAKIWLIESLGLSLNRLPGDIRMRGEGWSFHFPIVTSIVASVVLTVLLNLFFWFFRR